MPPKFRKFLTLIYEQLYLLQSDVVVFDEVDLRKAGLSDVDAKYFVSHLRDTGMLVAANSRRALTFRLPPTEHEHRMKYLKGRGWVFFPERQTKWQYAIQLKSRDAFLDFYKSLGQSRAVKKEEGVYYHAASGKGWANGKEFVFKDHQPEYRLFARLYAQIGEPVKRTEVLEILGLPPDDEKAPGMNHTATFHINDLVKKMRTRTTLKTHELVLNNGNITLVAQKLPDFPKKA
jgi:hypothetical protein